MVALADGKPETLGVKSIITHYVNHQKEVITRRTTKDLENAEKRFHIVEGFIKAINVLDEVIATIRASKSKKDAGINLINKFGFTEPQAEAILELMLYRLTGLEINIFEKEYKELEKTIKKLKKILAEEGIDFPNNANKPTAKAISVAAGIAQPDLISSVDSAK